MVRVVEADPMPFEDNANMADAQFDFSPTDVILGRPFEKSRREESENRPTPLKAEVPTHTVAEVSDG